MKKVVILALCICFLLCMAAPAFALEGQESGEGIEIDLDWSIFDEEATDSEISTDSEMAPDGNGGTEDNGDASGEDKPATPDSITDPNASAAEVDGGGVSVWVYVAVCAAVVAVVVVASVVVIKRKK